jgi:hypothetical protein
VQRLEAQGLEDQQVQGALDDIGVGLVHAGSWRGLPAKMPALLLIVKM